MVQRREACPRCRFDLHPICLHRFPVGDGEQAFLGEAAPVFCGAQTTKPSDRMQNPPDSSMRRYHTAPPLAATSRLA